MDPLELMKLTLLGQASETLNAASEQEQAFRAQVSQRQRLKARTAVQLSQDAAVSEADGRRQAEVDAARNAAIEHQRGENRLLSKHGQPARQVRDTVDTAQRITSQGGRVLPYDVAGASVYDFADTMAQVPYEMQSAKSLGSLNQTRRENAPTYLREADGWEMDTQVNAPDPIGTHSPAPADLLDELSFWDQFTAPRT